MTQFLYYKAHELCHGNMTGKRGENVTEVSIGVAGLDTSLFPIEFLYFVHFCGKYHHYFIFNDDISMLHH